MTKQKIINQLEKNVNVLKLAYSDLLTTRQNEGKQKYGSVAEFRKVKENVRVQIETLNTFLEWIYNKEKQMEMEEVPMFQQSDSKTNNEDTPDIMDGGINDVDYELMIEE